MLYQVAVKRGDTVVHTDTTDAKSPKDAAKVGIKYTQTAHDIVEVYDACDESQDAKPLYVERTVISIHD